ncbi:CGNR zinc finger domain-containing protein [Streptomyces sp. NPDC059506]|uniref:CGNR zinc finger domain-containing protein n=1 Tax=Streptomyces TaxID=1883 RepID=UPI0015FC1F73|nr:ABATE domain-containing protein [Streptomyces sp. SCUT-3]
MTEHLITQSDHHAPVEPLPVEFANTLSASRGVLVEGLSSPAALEAWLRRCRGLFPHPFPEDVPIRASEQQLLHTRMLRDSTRRLLTARIGRTAPDPWDVAQVNRACALSRSWPVLAWEGESAPRAAHLRTTDTATDARAQIARSLVALLTGDHSALLRICRGPGCVLFFSRNHPRRVWCSDGCGNRARVARHRERHPGDRT